MKQATLFVLCLLFSANAFAQRNQSDYRSDGFSIAFFFKYQDEAMYSINITSSEENNIFSFLETDCPPTQRDENIASTYYFNQFKSVLEELDIMNFQAQRNDLDLDAHLKVRILYTEHFSQQSNEISYQHNPAIQTDESRLLESLVAALDENVTRACNREVLKQLKRYIAGEEE